MEDVFVFLLVSPRGSADLIKTGNKCAKLGKGDSLTLTLSPRIGRHGDMARHPGTRTAVDLGTNGGTPLLNQSQICYYC